MSTNPQNNMYLSVQAGNSTALKRHKRLCWWGRSASGASETMKYEQQIHEFERDPAQPLMILWDSIFQHGKVIAAAISGPLPMATLMDSRALTQALFRAVTLWNQQVLEDSLIDVLSNNSVHCTSANIPQCIVRLKWWWQWNSTTAINTDKQNREGASTHYYRVWIANSTQSEIYCLQKCGSAQCSEACSDD